MRTLVISDLHLGTHTGIDLLRRPELRAPLMERLREIDRLVVLGDALELREVPVRDAAAHARPFFADAGQALGPDGEIVLLAGNHDHGILAGWIDTWLNQGPVHSLGLEQRIEPEQAGPLAVELAAAARPARFSLAYPGIWLRDDVYAIHGHYADIHSTVPTFERLAAGAMARWISPLPDHDATPDDYEAALAPIYAWIHALTQRSSHGATSAAAGASARAWVVLAGDGRRRRPLRAAALGAGYAAAVGAINAAGLGPVQRDLSGAALRRGYLHGFGEALRRLGVDAPYVVWGHSHRAGPFPKDDPAEWTAPTGSRLVNCGSWVYQRHFLTPAPNASPYWPGTAVLVTDDGAAPELARLLGVRGHADLAPPRGRRRA